MALVGRAEERRVLQDRLEHDESDFVVVYGRRRVGKTFLVREVFRDQFCFTMTGVANSPKAEQLRQFNRALNIYGDEPYPQALDWFEAFDQLRHLIERSPGQGKKKVVFLDEMPWLDTPKSGFISALESFWNGWAAWTHDIVLVVAGSSSAWLTRKLFRNTGGLYNRVTRRVWLRPFTLAECEAFFADRGMSYDRQAQVDSYMVFGGIPHYLDQFERGLSVAQNIDRLCFAQRAPLAREFDESYASLFAAAGHHVKVVEALAQRAQGLTRSDIAQDAKLASGGTLTKVLDDLELSDFVRTYRAFGKRRRDVTYQLADPFSLFSLRFLRNGRETSETFWTDGLLSGSRNAWKGHAFEQVCLAHLPQIKQALGISGMLASVSSWRSQESTPGAQIDLVIDRADRVVNLCEIKYSDHDYTITKDYDAHLREKRAAFVRETGTRKGTAQTFITTHGLAHNAYWGHVNSEVVMDDLFG
jgi:predicted AAA+ superfamily ATPase